MLEEMTKKYTAARDRGLALLDRVEEPGWWRRLDPHTQVTSASHCIGAQLHGTFKQALDYWTDMSHEFQLRSSAADFGFMITAEDDCEGRRCAAFATLNGVWDDVLNARRTA